jgi:hypothetical protein
LERHSRAGWYGGLPTSKKVVCDLVEPRSMVATPACILTDESRRVRANRTFKAGALNFGSGLVIVPYLEQGLVQQFNWLDERQFLIAEAIGMISPGRSSSRQYLSATSWRLLGLGAFDWDCPSGLLLRVGVTGLPVGLFLCSAGAMLDRH